MNIYSGVHRGRKGPFNTFSKNVFSKRVSTHQNQPNRSNFMHGSLCSVVKVSKRARKCGEKPKIWFKTRFLKKKLAWLI